MAVGKLYPYRAGQRVLWRGLIGTEAKLSTFRPFRNGQRVRLRGKDCDGKIAQGQIYKAGQRALARAAYLDCDTEPPPPGEPGVCYGCDYGVVPTSASVSISGFRSKVGTYAGAPCCNCLGQWERVNGTFQLTHTGIGGICTYGRVNDSNLQLFLNCSSCLSFYFQINFSLAAASVGQQQNRWFFFIGVNTGGLGGSGVLSMHYEGPLNQCGSVMRPSGLYTYVGSYSGLVPTNPNVLGCLDLFPPAVTIG